MKPLVCKLFSTWITATLTGITYHETWQDALDHAIATTTEATA